ncbi:AbrB/MazE/SpoVT family DNA-binding domain-containing protein [Lacticaseibacillus daqingensis]|uniref:AbrB/MazE/SpoVT family DNA-binding domain-containing protein n=1 Tax=Lacticaseibacillus daqingensis TaxID=2486014 RepID=UPI000F76BD7E|nr:hypothetical protein [Lacticaseibacillus daqingensis]
MTMRIKITLKHWDNDAGVHITKEMLAAAHFNPDAPIQLTVSAGKLLIQQPRPSLHDLFAHYHDFYLPTDQESAWLAAPAVGAELR